MKKYVVYLAVFSCLFLFNIGYCAQDGMVAKWDFEDVTDTSEIVNGVGDEYFGVLEKQATREETSSHSGLYGLNCMGANSSWMNAPGLGNYFADKSEISISIWIKPDGFDKERYLFSVMNSSKAQGLSATISANGTVKFQIRNVNATSGGIVATPTANLSPAVQIGEWANIICTLELPSVPGDKAVMKIYANGKLYSENLSADVGEMTTFCHFSGAALNNDFRIGGLGATSFYGSIDDVLVYDRAISPQEAEIIYKNIQPTRLISFKVGEKDFCDDENAKVDSFDDNGALYTSKIFPIVGIFPKINEYSEPSLSEIRINGEEISEENAKTLKMYDGDVITYALSSGEWENTEKTWKYKITLSGGDLSFSDMGFFIGEEKVEELKSGLLTAKARISNNNLNGKYLIIACIRKNGVIEKLCVSSEKNGLLQVQFDLTNNYDNISADFVITDLYLRPIVSKIEIK